MADDDQDYDDGVWFEDDYLYVEDSYAPADELAETAIPSPPPLDIIDDYFLPYDPYDYWMDIEYGTDEYYDVLTKSALKEALAASSSKRKLLADGGNQNQNKRRKTEPDQSDADKYRDRIWTGPNVVLIPCEEVYRLEEPCRACGKPAKYALLPNWREIAETQVSLSGHKVKASGAVSTQSNSDELPPSCTDENPQEKPLKKPSSNDQQIDPTQLMSILQRSLGGGSGDSSAAEGLQQMLLQMLSEGDGMDMEQLLENLTKSVLSQVEEGGADSDMGHWLAQQGVQLGEDGDSEEEDQVERQANDSETHQQADSGPSNGLRVSARLRGTTERQNSTGKTTGKTRKRKKSNADETIEDGGVQATLPKKSKQDSHNSAEKSTKGTKRKMGDDGGDRGPQKQARIAEASDADEIIEQHVEKRVTRSSRQKK